METQPKDMPSDSKARLRFAAICLALFLTSVVLRGGALGDSGLQNDEQLWHARSASFIQQLLGPFGPERMVVPKDRWPYEHVDASKSQFALISSWPFNIVMPAPHPGVSLGLLAGLSYILFGEGTSSWSMNLVPPLEAARFPAVVLGSLVVVLLYGVGRHIVDERAALLGAILASSEPILVGYSRLARLDMILSLWVVGSVLFFVVAYRKDRLSWALASGIFAGLAVTTHAYGVLAFVGIVLARLIYGEPSISGHWRNREYRPWRWGSRIDIAFILSLGVAFVFSYPNLWANPAVGVHQMLKVILGTPHVVGEKATMMPVSHFFYLVRAVEHIQPWILGLAGIGAVSGLVRRRKDILFLVLWICLVVLILSIPAGRKHTKNILQIMPVLMLLAGAGLVYLGALFTGVFPSFGHRTRTAVLLAGISGALFLASVSTVWQWWPYPQSYTWPWRPDPQELELRELVGTGEGVKEAIGYIEDVSGGGVRIACLTGDHNAAYYYDPALLGTPSTVTDLKSYSWLIVLPKLTFAGPDSNDLIRWIRSHQPTHIIRQNQIELVRIYKLLPGGD